MKNLASRLSILSAFTLLAIAGGAVFAQAAATSPMAPPATSAAPAPKVAAAPGVVTYNADKNHTQVSFVVRHMMSQVRGSFGDFSATIVKNDVKPEASSVEFTIQATSVNTGNENRDNHLRTEDFFFVEKFPEITFKSSKVEKVSDSEYKVTGDLTMRGVTKVITLPVNFLGEMKSKDGKSIAGFAINTKLDRKEFGINWNKALDNGGVLLSDEVAVEISIEAKQAS
ncbi:MAG: YceI family protein [Thermoanaerobaculia bacterium]